MNPENSLWGNLPLTETTRTPVIILREQATILTKLTNALLEGVVTVRNTADIFSFGKQHKEFAVTLSITAPALDGYNIQILKVEYDLVLYPATVYDLLGEIQPDEIVCRDESELNAAIGKVLSSEKVQKAVGMLLAQSRSTESDVAA